MNFSFLESLTDLEVFKRYCYEAEDFAFSYPDVSITAARKATEYLVKVLYGSAVNSMIFGMTVFDMLSDPRFIGWMKNDTLLSRFHYIRKMGNQAVHKGDMSKDDALKTLEHLHIVAGDICLRLGLIKSYPPFNPQLKCEAPEDEPSVDQALIARFAGRLHNVFAPSQQRVKKEIVESFISTKKMSEDKKSNPATKTIDTAANSRAAFQVLAEHIASTFGEENVLADYHEQLLHVITEKRRVTLAIRTSRCRVAVKSPEGEWLYMPGIDYVLYVDKLDTSLPVLSQFRVFTVLEFLKLWQDIDHVHPVVSAGTARRLKSVLGTDTKIEVEKYADELRVQNLNTVHRNKKKIIAEVLESLPTLENGGLDKVLS